MKIQFVVDDLPPNIKLVSTWEEIKENNGDNLFSKEVYLKCKALELNRDFEREIKKSRKILGIPESGYPFSPDIDVFKRNTHNKEIVRLNKLFSFDRTVKNLLPDLLYGNYIYHNLDVTDQSIISCRVDDYFGQYDDVCGDWSCVLISITVPITKNRLKRYIEENWSDIKGNLDMLSKKKYFYTSERDLRIFELKNENKKITYDEIANKIIEEFKIDDPEAKINSDSVKTAYKRAKKKIELLAKLKRK